MGFDGFVRYARRVVLVAGMALAVLVGGGEAAADENEIDSGNGAVGAEQHGSNIALGGNGGSSTLINAPAEVSVGDVETGDNSTNTFTMSSTIEMQSSSADGGDYNTAGASYSYSDLNCGRAGDGGDGGDAVILVDPGEASSANIELDNVDGGDSGGGGDGGDMNCDF